MPIAMSRASGPFEMRPLQWLPVSRQSSNLPMTATVTCGNGHEGLIDEHDISPNGVVTPSVVCTEDGCGWHEHIILDGWKVA